MAIWPSQTWCRPPCLEAHHPICPQNLLAPPDCVFFAAQVVNVVSQPSMTLVQQVLPAVPAATQALSADVGKPLASSEGGLAGQAAPAVKQEAALVLHDQVQHLAVQVGPLGRGQGSGGGRWVGVGWLGWLWILGDASKCILA
jgi:hypothetical protein